MNNIYNSSIQKYSSFTDSPLSYVPYLLKPFKFSENSSLLPDIKCSISQTNEDEYTLFGYNPPDLNLDQYCYKNWRNIYNPEIETVIDYAYTNNATKEKLQIQNHETRLPLELKVAFKFKNIDSVIAIYSNVEKELQNFTVLLDKDFYDFDLMNKIYSEIEFPILNELGDNKVISFEYIYHDDKNMSKPTKEYGDLIYKR